ncbi:DNA repair protein [Metschnikowia bicuspidata var. bicuspidata NRRL YB-4993]|uniref:DNA repair protein n=1 Tax=Metschnikowia bicuspidata var. bicuspidata NRRL YB-4993 TaxID=869754 RepID=A0A1A0HDA2_9ASCO|nr:DNA repair protein [Metschnikowia bicuspidata var. bicuspidata NRRL YB-4993]OBA22059.1 DNA repair protein [Metschnikowia bicuspidata var. bicuspidata NRRL YB-4993]
MAGLTDEQRKRIDENRRKALERLQQRKAGTLGARGSPAPSAKTSSMSNSAQHNSSSGAQDAMSRSGQDAIVGSGQQAIARGAHDAMQAATGPGQQHVSIPELPRVELTREQKARIEQNRERALQIQKEQLRTLRDASGPLGPVAVVTQQDRKRLKPEFNPPAIQKKDYIEYDFATMKDSRGGFLDESQKHGLKGPDEEPQSLKDWKEKQKQDLAVKDLAPPLDLSSAPRCVECESLEIDANLKTNFNVRVCRRCMREKPDKYALLTKTECREDYLLTEPELQDTGLLRRIEKPNPHGFLRMQLFLRLQVEEYAWKKWGSAEGLDAEWERREKARLDRREKRYQAKMREMRKKTRAEEYTRKLRNGQGLGDRHTHDWSAPLAVGGNDRLVRRRCVDCGIETEEIII